MAFKKDFTWGAATAAYQIEGAWNADGKGPSVWDQMVRWPGKVFQGHTGDVACDHYSRLDEDLDLMAAIGLKAYRFSVSWPRILPKGTGRVNEAGLDFYERMVDGLLERGIQPWCTLFHWDYPLALYHRGGWLNGDSPKWFEEYTGYLANRLGDRVKHWFTLNEPQIFVGLGHHVGVHAPGVKLPQEDIARIIHNVLLAHGRGVRALREHSKGCKVGFAPCILPSMVFESFADDVELIETARRHQFRFDLEDANIASGTSIWCDPVFLGRYPEAFLDAFGDALPRQLQADLKLIRAPLDFCGINIYASWGRWQRDEQGAIEYIKDDDYEPGYPRSLFGWPITPGSLYWGPRFLYERYGKPIVITENGMSCHDWVSVDGKVHDPQRIDFTTRYLRELERAARHGIDVQGYFHWSLMDNFEWAEGYKHRFGLIHVNMSTGVRTPKDSADWYRKVIASNGTILD